MSSIGKKMKKVYKKYFQIILPIIAIVLLAALGYIYKASAEENEKLIINFSKQIVELNSSNISLWLKNRISELNLLSKLDEIESGNWNRMEPILKEVVKKNEDIYSFLMFALPDGSYYTTNADKAVANISDRDYFQSVFSEGKQNFVSSAKISRSTGLMVFYISLPVKNNIGEIVGAIVGVIKLTTISDIAAKMHINNSGFGWIVDSTGYVVAHPNKDFLMKMNIFESSKYGFENLDILGEKITAGDKGLGYIIRPNKEKAVVVFQPIAFSPSWSLGITVPRKVMFESINYLFIVLVVIFLITVVLLFILVWVITKKIIIRYIEKISILNNDLELKTQELEVSNKELKASNGEIYLKQEQLNQKNNELSKTIIDLKDTQSKLIQSEKMASLGVLTAGVAHEINNPLNFIMGSYSALLFYFESHCTENKKVSELFESLKTGIDRTAEIVKGLNQFSSTHKRKDEQCDINSIIDNCLVLLNNQIINKIEIVKNYEKDLSHVKVKGNIGELNQVFLNILLNAIDAIVLKGRICIQTKNHFNSIVVEITDNGCGINKDNLPKVLDPFFTTKDPGKGTGLGLSISYTIIKEHKGSIEIISDNNKGTTVSIKLPINE